MKKKVDEMKCEGSGLNCAILARGVRGRTNERVSLLLQSRVQWKHADNEDRITQSV